MPSNASEHIPLCGLWLSSSSLIFPRASSHDQLSIVHSDCYLVVEHDADKFFIAFLFPEDQCEVIMMDDNGGDLR